jgi:hypothetical protein
VTISGKFAREPGSPLYQAVLMAFVAALLAWSAYSVAAALQPSCPHDTGFQATPLGASRLMGTSAGLTVAVIGDVNELCCQDLHDRVVAQPSLLALPSAKSIPVAAAVPMQRAALFVAPAAPPSRRASHVPSRAGTALYLRTQRLLI